jgi:MFS family permease
VDSAADVAVPTHSRFRLRFLRYTQSPWPGERLSSAFWVFFVAAFFFDFGFGLYFFLFNLFLANLHFNERIIGIVAGALTLGNVAGTIPVSLLVRRFGLQRVLLLCFIAAPLFSILRTLLLSMPAQVGLAFSTGVAMSCWPVCFPPAAAKLTTENNRVSGFSILFATGIGTGTLAGLVGGYLPGLFRTTGGTSHIADSMRPVLLLACGVVMLGIWPILHLRLGRAEHGASVPSRFAHPFLLRFLPAFALWSVVTGSFAPFAAIFLQKHLGLPLKSIGLIFSGSQLAQVAAVLLAPFLFRRFGTVGGIMCTQIATGVAVLALGRAQSASMAVVCYLGYTGVLFMSGPGFYSMLMSRLPEEERGKASAAQNLVGAVSQAVAAFLTGGLVVRYGYPAVLSGNAVVAIAAALLLLVLLGSIDKAPVSQAGELWPR